MPTPLVTVAPLGHEMPELPTVQITNFELPSPVHVLLLLVGRGVSAIALDNLVNTYVLPTLKDDPDSVLVRVHPTSYDSVLHHIRDRRRVVGRFRSGLPFGVITTDRVDRNWKISWVAGSADEVLPAPNASRGDEAVLTVARDAEFRLFSYRPAALLPESEYFHYEGPNEAHYRSYFRGGLALSIKDHIDGLAFWVWPQVVSGEIIVVDNPTLLATGFGISDYVRREIEIDGKFVPLVEARDFYGEQAATLAARLEAVAGGTSRPVVVLSSIVSTGRSLDALREACAEAGFTDVRDLVIFGDATNSSTPPALHQLPIDLSKHAAAECSYCHDEQLPVVRIRPETNLVEVSALVRESSLTLNAAAQVRDFFERYAEYEDVVMVHRDQHDSRRHHVIDFAVEALCDVPVFRTRLYARLREHQGKTAVVLHPQHAGARRIATEVAQFLGLRRIEADPLQLGQLPDTARAVIRSCELLLVADDVSVTGSRLRQYRSQLNATRLIDFAGMPAVGAVFGVLRPASSARRQGIVDMVDRGPNGPLLVAVEEVLLPDWFTPDCPWCREFEILSRVSIPAGTLLADRRDHLRQARRSSGLIRDLFLPWAPQMTFRVQGGELLPPTADDEILTLASLGLNPDDAHGTDTLDLGPRSVLGELRTEAQVFVAVAATVQTLRDAESKRGAQNALSETFTSPTSRVLRPEHYMSGRFYAPVIVGSILRACRSFDLRATAVDRRLADQVNERMADSPAIRAEMLFAMARGLLPRPGAVRDASLLDLCDDSVRSALEQLGVL
jgi:hypothetical protein